MQSPICKMIQQQILFDEFGNYRKLHIVINDSLFCQITGHEGPLTSNDASYQGCSLYNVMIKWENGEIALEPLSMITTNGLATWANYARENNILDLPGWTHINIYKPNY